MPRQAPAADGAKMSKSAPAVSASKKPKRGKHLDGRLSRLEVQVQQLMEDRYGPVTARERFEELWARAVAIGGVLSKAFNFDAEGHIVCEGRALAFYERPYWLAHEATGLVSESIDMGLPVTTAVTTTYSLPRQFDQLACAIGNDEQAYQERLDTLAYEDEGLVTEIMQKSGFEQRLQRLAEEAGGSLVCKRYKGKSTVYYYRYKRLKQETVFCSLLKHQPYHAGQHHRYAFWLPIDYCLLRQLLKHDAALYAALPDEAKRPS